MLPRRPGVPTSVNGYASIGSPQRNLLGGRRGCEDAARGRTAFGWPARSSETLGYWREWPVRQAVFDCPFKVCCSFPALRLCEDQLLLDSLLTAE